MSIRKLKKLMKNSNGFFTLRLKDDTLFCSNEWNMIKYYEKGISFDKSVYIPYKYIRKIYMSK